MILARYKKEAKELIEHIEDLITQTGNEYQDVIDKIRELITRGKELTLNMPEENRRKGCEIIVKKLEYLETEYLVSVINNLNMELEILMGSIKDLNKGRTDVRKYIFNAGIVQDQANYVSEICDFLKRNIPKDSSLAWELNNIEGWENKVQQIIDTVEEKGHEAEMLLDNMLFNQCKGIFEIDTRDEHRVGK